MVAKPLEVTIRHHDGVVVIDLEGDINAFAEETLNAAYTEATDDGPDALLLNFEGVDYINSTGISLIVTLLAKARKSGLRLMTSGLSDHFVEVFQITRLSDFMSIFPDEESAVADVSKPA